MDGSSYLYRAFHALPPLTSSKGEPTGAVLGVLNMLNKLMKEESPQRVAMVFDAPGRTFRDDLFDQYKAHRTPMPDDLRSQLQPLLEAVTALGLPLLRVAGVEADDVIGTLAVRAAAAGFDVLISTGDKDMAQLVDPHISLVNTMSNTRLDRDGVKAKFDVFPEQMVDYLALVGDSSDNIPGITGVGPKTAAKWLNQYGTLDSLIAHAAEIAGKVGENLRGELPALELSRKLATIDAALTLEVGPEDLLAGTPDLARLRELYGRLELRALAKSLDTMAPPADAAPSAPAGTAATAAGTAAAVAATAVDTNSAAARSYEAVVSRASLDAWIAKLEAASLIAIDTETGSLDYMHGRLLGLAFAVAPGDAAYIPLGHDYTGAPAQLTLDEVLGALKPLLEDPALPKLGRRLKFDTHILANHGITLRGQRYDSMLESYVLDSVATRHDMESTAARYLGTGVTRYEDLVGKGAKQIPFGQVDVQRAADYAGEEAETALRLHHVLRPRLEAASRLQSSVRHHRTAAVAGSIPDGAGRGAGRSRPAPHAELRTCRAHGAAGDTGACRGRRRVQSGFTETTAGDPVRQARPAGRAQDSHGPAVHRRRRARGTGAGVRAAEIDPRIPRRVQTQIHVYRQAAGADQRAHRPNSYLVPTDGGGDGPVVLLRSEPAEHPHPHRGGPPHPPGVHRAEGYSLVAADYSQIELRIMAHLSSDASLLKAFAEDRDIHQATAAEVLGLPAGEVSADQRRSAKAVNFGLIYGMSAFGLARQLGISRGDAQRYVDLYFERYPGVKRYMDETRAQARELGYVETVFGRRLYLPEIRSRNAALRQYAERSAINAPMQGTAADIIKRAMIEVDAWLEKSQVPARLIMQVHDELVLEVADDAVESTAARLREHMMAAAELAVPLKVDVGIGLNWDEAH